MPTTATSTVSAHGLALAAKRASWNSSTQPTSAPESAVSGDTPGVYHCVGLGLLPRPGTRRLNIVPILVLYGLGTGSVWPDSNFHLAVRQSQITLATDWGVSVLLDGSCSGGELSHGAWVSPPRRGRRPRP